MADQYNRDTGALQPAVRGPAHHAGETLEISAQFYSDLADTIPADPASVVLDWTHPDGTIDHHDATDVGGPIEHPGLGQYTAQLVPPTSGRYAARWEGMDLLQTQIIEDTVDVLIPPGVGGPAPQH